MLQGHAGGIDLLADKGVLAVRQSRPTDKLNSLRWDGVALMEGDVGFHGSAER